MLGWQGSRGFSVDASVRIEGQDRAGVERLVRYCARPPFALERLHAIEGGASLASPDSRLLYRFSRPDLEGRTELLLSPLELLERIARFVPPPRVHRRRLACAHPLGRPAGAHLRSVAPACPACGGEMKVLAFLTDPPVVSSILLHLELPHRPPPLSPAPGPPQIEPPCDEIPSDPSHAFDPRRGRSGEGF